jgi:radical SAM protein with 4Fe4S-binding SPASM domain
LVDSLKISKSLVDNEVFEVVLTGGEPLYRRDLLYPVASFLSSENIDVKLNTNLTLIKKEDFPKMRDSGILTVFGSLPSHNEETYNKITQTKNFGNAIKGLEMLVDSGISTGINMVVTKLNNKKIYEMGEFLHDLGINIFCATPASPCQYMPKDIELSRDEVVRTLDNLLKLREDFGMKVDVVEPLPRCIVQDSEKYELFLRRDCAAGKLTIAISSEGNVNPCTHISKSYGNLLTQDLSSIWKNMGKWRDGSYIPSECNPCTELKICSLGCREAARIEKGSYADQDPWAKDIILESRKQKEDDELEKNAIFRIPEKIRFRRESEGFAVFCSNTHSIVYLNEPFFDVLKNLYERENFTVEGLQKEFGKEHDFPNIVKFLKKRGLVS